jgi:ketosteroid isomerase-like protein
VSDDEAEIRRILEGRRQALHAKDAAALTAHDAPDMLAFDLAPPLLVRGIDQAGLEAWLGEWEGPVELAFHELAITIGQDVAFSTSLNRMQGTAQGEERMDLWVRATLGYRKVKGRWQVVHEHLSVPFYMDGSGRAALDLKP